MPTTHPPAAERTAPADSEVRPGRAPGANARQLATLPATLTYLALFAAIIAVAAAMVTLGFLPQT